MQLLRFIEIQATGCLKRPGDWLIKLLLLLAMALSLMMCVSSRDAQSIDQFPLNKIQVIGSHNSYKQEIDDALFAIIKQSDSLGAKSLQYSHLSLPEQLSLGLLDLEIDFYADTAGGRYAHPKGLVLESHDRLFDPDNLMKNSGFKVLHIQDIDFRSNCLTLENCLRELRLWSDQHRDHFPVFITMNAKDDTPERVDFAVPEKYTPPIFDALDTLVIKILGADKVITPDFVRGNHKTLVDAILNQGWPTLLEAKGKFIFILDETGEKQSAYLKNHEALKGRVLFVNAAPGTPSAAILIMNDPKEQFGLIQEHVRKGYIVRTRADADTWEARQNDYSRFEKACASGAQIITTDYYLPSTYFRSTYRVRFDNGGYLRKNPLFSK